MKKILFLDDEPARHARFRMKGLQIDHSVTFVFTYYDAIAALTAHVFDEVWLDHDLSEQAAAGRPGAHEKTGYHVACYIEAMAKKQHPKFVYVHSMNDSGAKRMIQALQQAGVPCARTYV